MANIMDPADEPAKWVCHLFCEFEKEGLVHGTGFLVNMPDTNKYCIMTAGHNIKRPGVDYALSIRAEFTNTLSFTAYPGEYFVSAIFHKYTTLKATDEGSISDYGLITVDRGKVNAPPALDLRGCAFSAMIPTSTLVHLEGTVHGYKHGSPEQAKNTSEFYIVQHETVSYTKVTKPGVSGGPVFVSQGGSDIAVAIHNYDMRATRLTYAVLLEMLSWIKDYGLIRTLEDADRRGVFLHTTTGSRPNVLARPGLDGFSTFHFVVVAAAKNDARLSHHRFALSPAERRPSEEGKFYFLTISDDNDETDRRAVLRATANPGRDSSFALNREGKMERFLLTSGLVSTTSLTVRPTKRCGGCDCGCISRDDLVGFDPIDNTAFVLSPPIKDFTPKKPRARR